PYETTSCTFFNRKGLDTTMRSLGCEAIDCKTLGDDLVERRETDFFKSIKDVLRKFRSGRRAPPQVNRQFLTYRKNVCVRNEGLATYWDGLHRNYSKAAV